MAKQHCLVCGRIKQIQNGENPYFVAELPSGYIVLGDYQFFRGYTVFISKIHATELHQLQPTQRTQFLEDMAVAAEAVYRTFEPQKLNYELQGNLDSHMHWHIYPRYSKDPQPHSPVGAIPVEIRKAATTRPSIEELKIMKQKLQEKLTGLSCT